MLRQWQYFTTQLVMSYIDNVWFCVVMNTWVQILTNYRIFQDMNTLYIIIKLLYSDIFN